MLNYKYNYIFSGFEFILVYQELVQCFPRFVKMFRMRALSSLTVTSSQTDLECSIETDATAPFCDALRTVKQTLKHRFFFPGHGGLCIPKFVEDIGSNSFTYDMPELDGLDNIHFPEVESIAVVPYNIMTK